MISSMATPRRIQTHRPNIPTSYLPKIPIRVKQITQTVRNPKNPMRAIESAFMAQILWRSRSQVGSES